MPALKNRTVDTERVPAASPVTTGSHDHDGGYLLAMVYTIKPYGGASRKTTLVDWNSTTLDYIGRMDYDSGNSVDRDLTVDFWGKSVSRADATGEVTHDGTTSQFRVIYQSFDQLKAIGNIGSDDLTTFNSSGTNVTFAVTNSRADSMALGVIAAQNSAAPFSPNGGTTELEDVAGSNFDLWLGYRTGNGSQSFDIDFSAADAGGKAIELIHAPAGNQSIIIG